VNFDRSVFRSSADMLEQSRRRRPPYLSLIRMILLIYIISVRHYYKDCIINLLRKILGFYFDKNIRLPTPRLKHITQLKKKTQFYIQNHKKRRTLSFKSSIFSITTAISAFLLSFLVHSRMESTSHS
jgi:hypothetical protein